VLVIHRNALIFALLVLLNLIRTDRKAKRNYKLNTINYTLKNNIRQIDI
jgi:hypothetical protein